MAPTDLGTTTVARLARLLTTLLLLLAVASPALASRKSDRLQQAQYAYSSAIRWGDFEGAWTMVSADFREANPKTELEFERYKQIQVSSYRDRPAQPISRDEVTREVEIGVINRHTMAERSIRYIEHWRYDPEVKGWFLVGDLPDFWAGL